MYLVDTNVWLELLLNQERAEEVRSFFKMGDASLLAITEFSLYSIAVILTQLKKDALFQNFLTDTLLDSGVMRICLQIEDFSDIIEFRQHFFLDFDDAYQYVASQKHNFSLVSFDSDFDRTPRGRKTPAEILADKNPLAF
ncbi:MAG: PIN domain-containing protein [Candidatus Omnitrophota bacterium]